jgi:hypothetical protein
MERNLASAAAILVTAMVVNQRSSAPLDNVSTATPAQTQVQAATKTRELPQYYSTQAGIAPPAGSESAESKCAPGTQCVALVPYKDTGPWVASCSWFGVNSKSSPARAEPITIQESQPEQTGASRDDWCLGQGPVQPHLKFLVVTLPDPVSTHLALGFDRAIEAIEAAAQTYKLYLTRYWLPWKPEGDPAAPGDSSQDLQVRRIMDDFRSAQPGLLIFTAPPGASTLCGTDASDTSPCALYVFVVTESPTSGINRSEFKNATRYVRALSSGNPDAGLYVVGPSFTGSIPSMTDLYQQLRNEQPFEFVSGTMTGEYQCGKSRADAAPLDRTVHEEVRAREFFLNFLRDQRLTVDGRNVLILREDETRYGGGGGCRTSGDSAGSFAHLRSMTFPRELSRLRNASADSFGMPAPVAADSDPLPEEGLRWNWRDAGKGQDSVPSFSGAQEPLSQQAVMLSIADVIRQQKIQYVGITATDIFDILFLSKLLKLAAPNARLFVLDADRLMVRTSEAGRELDGTLVVSTYPLITTKQDTRAQPSDDPEPFRPSTNVFPSRNAEGTYNAVLVQLNRQHPNRDQRDHQQVMPPWTSIADERQPLWLTVVGRTSFWPVSMDKSRLGGTDDKAPTKPSGDASLLGAGAREMVANDSPDNTTLLLDGALLLWGAVHLIGMWAAFKAGYPWLAQFRVRPSEDVRVHAQHQNFYLMCATLALSNMLALIAICVGWLWWDTQITLKSALPLRALYFSIAVVALALLLVAAWLVRRRPFNLVKPGILLFAPWLIYLATVVLWWCLNSRQTVVGMFFAHRSLYMSNGASPLLPVELLLLLYFSWSWIFVRKVRLSESRQVHVPELDKLGPSGQGFDQCCHKLLKATDALVFHRQLALWIAAAFVAVVIVLLRPAEALRSIEGRPYDIAFVLLVMWVCLLVMLVWGRYLYIWGKLRRILRGLERTPLRRAFSRLPKNVYSWSPLWYEDAERRAYTISARSLECFQALVSLNGFGFQGPDRLAEMTRAFKAVVELDCRERGEDQVARRRKQPPSPKGDERSRAVARLQKILVRTAEVLLERYLCPRWETQGGSDSLEQLQQGDQGTSPGLDDDRKAELLREEFVALRYIGLIHYETAQMKNLAMLLVIGFVLALMSVGSYPFLAGRQWVWVLAVVFVVFGAAIVISFAQMSRDAILSRISGTDPGKLDLSFFLRVLSYGALPLVALLTSQFPSVGRSLFSWVQPALNALH